MDKFVFRTELPPIFVFLTKGERAKPELKHALFNYSMQPIFAGCKDKLNLYSSYRVSCAGH